jgi:hypothetical protein
MGFSVKRKTVCPFGNQTKIFRYCSSYPDHYRVYWLQYPLLFLILYLLNGYCFHVTPFLFVARMHKVFISHLSMRATCLVCVTVPSFKQNNSQYLSPRCCKTFMNVPFLCFPTRDMRLFKYFLLLLFFRFLQETTWNRFWGVSPCVWRFSKEVQLLTCSQNGKISVVTLLPCGALSTVRALFYRETQSPENACHKPNRCN